MSILEGKEVFVFDLCIEVLPIFSRRYFKKEFHLNVDAVCFLRFYITETHAECPVKKDQNKHFSTLPTRDHSIAG